MVKTTSVDRDFGNASETYRQNFDEAVKKGITIICHEYTALPFRISMQSIPDSRESNHPQSELYLPDPHLRPM